MDEDGFWALIEQSGGNAPGEEPHGERLVEMLARLSAVEILQFRRHFARRVVEGYRWDLMAISYIVNGGHTGEAYDAFLGWVMAHGRTYWDAALADPERAADAAEPGKRAEFEAIWTAPALAYQRSTGMDDFYENADPISIVMDGDRWKPEELGDIYPALVEKFGR